MFLKYEQNKADLVLMASFKVGSMPLKVDKFVICADKSRICTLPSFLCAHYKVCTFFCWEVDWAKFVNKYWQNCLWFCLYIIALCRVTRYTNMHPHRHAWKTSEHMHTFSLNWRHQGTCPPAGTYCFIAIGFHLFSH